MFSLLKFVVVALAASLATAKPLTRRLASGNSSIVNQLKQQTQVDKITSLIQDEPDFGNFKFSFLGGLKPGSKGGVVVANGQTFPVTVGTGISAAVLFLPPCGMVGAHTHPRASEFLITTNATIKSGFVMETGASTFIDVTLGPLEGMVYPMGSIHFQFNDNCSPTVLYAALNNEDPGASFIAPNFFSLNDNTVSANLGFPKEINGKTIKEFAGTLPIALILGSQECARRCNLPGAPVLRDVQ